jgi:hypothetical protein
MLLNAPSIAASDRDVAGNRSCGQYRPRDQLSRRVSEGLLALGLQQIAPCTTRSENSPMAICWCFGSTERIPVDQQGPGPVDVLGDIVIDLD